jgi:hypothetical protein
MPCTTRCPIAVTEAKPIFSSSQSIRKAAGPVIGGLDAATFRQTLNRVVESQNRAGQANAVNLSRKPSLQRIASLIQREPDARRASVDRQDAWVSGFHVAPSFFSPNEASFAHVDL